MTRKNLFEEKAAAAKAERKAEERADREEALKPDKVRIKVFIENIEGVQCQGVQSLEVIAALIRFLTALDGIVTDLESDMEEINS